MNAYDEFIVLSRALDALDRLYDGESRPVDIEAILRVVGVALSSEPLGEQILSVADQLVKAISSAVPEKLTTEEALSITDLVRVPIAEAWSDLDAQQNRD